MKQRVNDKGIAVPKKCQKCGSPVVMKLRGEPVYMCDKCDEYYGTVPCNVTESFMDEYKNFIRLIVPSDKATEYLKKDPELKQYWEQLNRDTNGEILVDPNTKEQIGYGFVYHSGENKGFIFNIEVMEKFRRQGFGTIILNDCVTKFGGVDLTVACDNEGAIKLYLKYGFEIVETVKGQNGRDEYYMKLKKSKAVQEGFVDTLFTTRTGFKVPSQLPKYDAAYLQSHANELRAVRKGDSNYYITPESIHDTYLFEQFDDLMKNIAYSTDFDKYNELRHFLFSVLGLPENCTVNLDGYWPERGTGCNFKIRGLGNQGKALAPTDVLYHSSMTTGLTELVPAFMSRKSATTRARPGVPTLKIEALFPEPRVYVGLNKCIGRVGSDVMPGSKERVYKILHNPKVVYVDGELSGGAAYYIQSQQPIPVEDVTDEYFAKLKAKQNPQQPQSQQTQQTPQTQKPQQPTTVQTNISKPTTPAPQQTTQPTPSVTPVKPEQKPTAEFSDLTFDQLIAVTDLILEYDVLYNDSNDIFMESITEPYNVQEAVPGLWEDYLTQHTGYDSKTHTFIDPKTQKRVQAPFARGTSKEMNRRNAFLKRHNFNPENGTIEIDEIDPSTGQKMRVPVEFIMGSRKIGDIRNSKMSMNPTDGVPYDFVSAKMRLGGTDLMKRGDLTEPWFGHETAHAHQANAIRRQLRTQPHHRQLDDLLAARQRAKESGNYERMYEYDQKVHDYIQTHRTALEKESKHFTLGGWDAVDKLLADDSRYKRAAENSKKHNADLSTHDVSPWELHADDYGGRLSSKYTRGKNKMVDALQANADPVRNDMIHSARKTLANKGVDASAVSDETIERTVVDKPKSHEVRKQIARENVAVDAAKEMQDQKYRRKLAKETLQTQVASGKLTPQQEQKAKKKIAAIDAYDKKTSTIQEAFYMNPNTFDVVQVGSEDTIKIDGVDWFEVDEAMIPLIQLCNKKGYTTSFSCSGHSPGMHEYSSDGKRLTSRRFNGFPYVAFAKIHDFKNLPTGWTYETFSDDGKSALYYNDAPNAFPTDKWDRIMAREENIIHAIRELCVYFDTKLPDLTNESVQESFIMEAHAPKKLYFHVSPARYYDGQVFKPRVPEYIEPYDPNDKHFEDSTTPRVCFSTSIEGALNAITVNIQRTNPVTFDTMYVYIPEKPINEYKHKTNKELVKEKRVYDANVTDEIWIMEPVRMKLYGAIHVDQCKRVKKKSTVAAANGARATRNQFTYKWHWLVKPKVLDKATEFRYDTMTVCNNLADELNHFRYGLIKDGKLDTKASDKDYDKYWKLATPEEFEQAGGGICYDFVEWEAGYLDTYGIRCNKFFASCMGQNDEYATHTFIVVKDNGKYIYIEKAFKRISDEIHNIKVFDKLDDIFDYVVETMVEYEHVPEFNYGIIEYTDDTPKAGTPMHEYQYWISKNGKFIKTGNMKANKKKE